MSGGERRSGTGAPGGGSPGLHKPTGAEGWGYPARRALRPVLDGWGPQVPFLKRSAGLPAPMAGNAGANAPARPHLFRARDSHRMAETWLRVRGALAPIARSGLPDAPALTTSWRFQRGRRITRSSPSSCRCSLQPPAMAIHSRADCVCGQARNGSDDRGLVNKEERR